MATTIRVHERATGRTFDETVYGERGLRFLYETALGRRLADSAFARRWFGRLLGAWYGSRRSARAIPAFIERYGIPIDDFEPGPWESFDAFFVRRYRAGVRPFDSAESVLPAFAEARYLGFASAGFETPVRLKGVEGRIATPAELVAGRVDPAPFEGGPLLVARLAPVDYHRFHFPDDGRVIDRFRHAGRYHSVSPIALSARPEALVVNEREVSVLETEHFGRLLYVEVGAMGVGRIVSTHRDGVPFSRGDEKGYFAFGASTVVVAGEPGRFVPCEDVRENTSRGVETLVRLGRPIAVTPRRDPG